MSIKYIFGRDRQTNKDWENKPKGPVFKSLNSLDNLFSSISGNRPTLNSQLFVYYEDFFFLAQKLDLNKTKYSQAIPQWAIKMLSY